MRQAWRWYGPDDPVTLDHVRQAGAREIVTALHQYPPGVPWPREAVAARKALIEHAPGRTPLAWTVVESIPLPDDILRASPGAPRAIAAWIESMRAVAAEGIRIICYNVMPVVDWTRTDLDHPLPTGATALRFDHDRFAAFDLHVLGRENADYEAARNEQSFLEGRIRDLEQMIKTVDEGFTECRTVGSINISQKSFSSSRFSQHKPLHRTRTFGTNTGQASSLRCPSTKSGSRGNITFSFTHRKRN